MDYEKQIDTIISATEQVQIDRVTILTGKNGTGKSMVRKILSARLAPKMGTDPKHTVASVSMESRSNSKSDFSAFNSQGIDDPTNPTSGESIHNIDMLVKCGVSEKEHKYLVIDEPEIGMGEEMVAALVLKLNKMFDPLPPGCRGIMIITHNRQLVRDLKAEFVNLDGLNRQEWLDREIVPTDLEKFKIDSLELYRAIQKRIQKRSEEN